MFFFLRLVNKGQSLLSKQSHLLFNKTKSGYLQFQHLSLLCYKLQVVHNSTLIEQSMDATIFKSPEDNWIIWISPMYNWGISYSGRRLITNSLFCEIMSWYFLVKMSSCKKKCFSVQMPASPYWIYDISRKIW